MSEKISHLYRKDIRFSKYTPLLLALSPAGAFSPATIADFAISTGLGRLIHPRQDFKLMRMRIRIALGQYSRNNQFPRQADSLLFNRARAFREWFGWRWQKYNSLAEGIAALRDRIGPILEQMDPGLKYGTEDLYQLWSSLPLEEPGYSYKRGRPGWPDQWQQLNSILIRESIRNYAQIQDLDPNQHYVAERWLTHIGPVYN